jgi:hypothetical protein
MMRPKTIKARSIKKLTATGQALWLRAGDIWTGSDATSGISTMGEAAIDIMLELIGLNDFHYCYKKTRLKGSRHLGR